MVKKMSNKVTSITHDEDKRKNIPTAELQSIMQKDDLKPIQVEYKRRNLDLDPQLVWKNKSILDEDLLTTHAPPLYIQEKVHPKLLIEDISRQRDGNDQSEEEEQIDLFSDFNGLPNEEAKTEFYKHEGHWTNRMILGDGLQAMSSLSEREGLKGQVQCIFFDPPYGVKFNSNFQWSTTSKNVTDGKLEHITREPEQVKAFRDTWRDGIHSYLSYIRDRLIVSRDLLAESGSIFVQISDENVHLVRCLLDEVFGSENFISLIPFRKKTMPFGSSFLEQMSDFIIWYGKKKRDTKGNPVTKYRKLFLERSVEGEFHHCWYETPDGERHRMSRHQIYNHSLLPPSSRVYRLKSLEPSGRMESGMFDYEFEGKVYKHPKNGYGTTPEGMDRLKIAGRLQPEGSRLCYVLYADETSSLTAPWTDTVGADSKKYVVQTNTQVIKRCILMTTDPGDLVLDPTCGSGTSAFVSEYWGRRWITIDTSRVALALARSRMMGGRYPFYVLSDSREGEEISSKLDNRDFTDKKKYQNNIKQGFVYKRVFNTTVGSIANNEEVSVINDSYARKFDDAISELKEALGSKSLSEFEVPFKPLDEWTEFQIKAHKNFLKIKNERLKKVTSSIEASAEYDYRYDEPYEINKKVRVSGPFTVESLAPHRSLAVDENDNPITTTSESGLEKDNFLEATINSLKVAGVQQSSKDDKIEFSTVNIWPGEYICCEGRYTSSGEDVRAAIFIGPEYGTVSRSDLVAAAREAADADFDILITCAFSYDAHSTEVSKLGRINILKARMNADLHMSDDLKDTGKGNLFVIFGEPDVDINKLDDNKLEVVINGVDVFDPNSGEVRSDDTSGIACWFIDTNYNEESFFVRHAYFLGANNPYEGLARSLKSEINPELWKKLSSNTSRPFKKPKFGRIAIKVINHLGDEVMKVYKVD